jgi:dynein light chain 1
MSNIRNDRQNMKRAIEGWIQEHNGANPADAKEIKLNFLIPSLDRLDPMILSTLVNCTKLSLSTNTISMMVPFNGMKNLEVLSLSRNQIRKITGLDEVGATLKQLWLSYNIIDSLSGLSNCTALEVLYLAHNRIKDWGEVDKLADLKKLQSLVLLGNDIYDKLGSEAEARIMVVKKLSPTLDLLDGRSTNEERKGLGEEGAES